MMTPKEATFIIPAVKSVAFSERCPPRGAITALSRKMMQGSHYRARPFAPSHIGTVVSATVLGTVQHGTCCPRGACKMRDHEPYHLERAPYEFRRDRIREKEHAKRGGCEKKWELQNDTLP